MTSPERGYGEDEWRGAHPGWYWDADAWSTRQKVDFWLWFVAFCPVCLLLLGRPPEGRWRRRSAIELAQKGYPNRRAADEAALEELARRRAVSAPRAGRTEDE